MVPFANILFTFRDYIICVDNALAADSVIYIKGSNYFLFFVVHELIFLYGFFNVLYCFTALAWISCIKERWNWIICSNWSSPKVILQVLVHTTLSYYLHVTLKKHLPLLNVGGTVDVNFCLFVFLSWIIPQYQTIFTRAPVLTSAPCFTMGMVWESASKDCHM